MKKLVFAAITLMAAAGSTLTIPASSSFTVAATAKPKPAPLDVPPATCPWNDPNGCCIYCRRG